MTLPAVLTDLLKPAPGCDRNAVRLIAILVLSNEAEAETCPFRRRLALNEMQAAIQAVRDDIEAMAEGFMMIEDEDQ